MEPIQCVECEVCGTQSLEIHAERGTRCRRCAALARPVTVEDELLDVLAHVAFRYDADRGLIFDGEVPSRAVRDALEARRAFIADSRHPIPHRRRARGIRPADITPTPDEQHDDLPKGLTLYRATRGSWREAWAQILGDEVSGDPSAAVGARYFERPTLAWNGAMERAPHDQAAYLNVKHPGGATRIFAVNADRATNRKWIAEKTRYRRTEVRVHAAKNPSDWTYFVWLDADGKIPSTSSRSAWLFNDSDFVPLPIEIGFRPTPVPIRLIPTEMVDLDEILDLFHAMKDTRFDLDRAVALLLSFRDRAVIRIGDDHFSVRGGDGRLTDERLARLLGYSAADIRRVRARIVRALERIKRESEAECSRNRVCQ